jgi:hypothetical protein
MVLHSPHRALVSTAEVKLLLQENLAKCFAVRSVLKTPLISGKTSAEAGLLHLCR